MAQGSPWDSATLWQLVTICLPYFFFVGIGMWHFFISDMLEPVYESVHEKLATK